MKKKIIALLLICCMLLSACAKEQPSGDNNTDTQVTSQDGTQTGTKQTGDGTQTGTNQTGDGTQTGDATQPGTSQNSDAAGEAGDSTANANDDAKILEKFDGPAIKLDYDTTYQEIDGFGAAFTWYGEILLNSKDPEGGLDKLFSLDEGGFSILRFKNEYEYRQDGKAPNTRAMVSNYRAARDRAGLKGQEVKVLLSCWSPPAKLKSDSSISKGTGTLAKHDDGTYMYEEYADWWAQSVKYYREQGVKIDFVSIQNEVDFGPDSYEGCMFDPKENEHRASYAKAFLAVYEAFKREFGDDAPKMLAPETMSCVPGTLISYTKEITDTAPESMYGLAFHLYVGGTGDEDNNEVKPTSFMTNFMGMNDLFKDTKKWQTEYFIGRGIQTAELIHSALTYANLNAYIYWSGVWAEGSKKLESNHIIEVDSNGNWRPSANYYALRHFAQFIRPGYVRIDAISEDKKAKVSAYTNEANTKSTLVVINNNDEARSFKVEGNDYTITDSCVYTSEFGDDCEDGSKLYQNTGALKGGAIFDIPAKSVVTVDITGYRGNVPVDYVEPAPIVYSDEDITPEVEIPENDVVLMDKHFDEKSELTGLSGMGSGSVQFVENGAGDGNNCIVVTNRGDAWHGMSISSSFFENYGYLVKISYDCMMQNGGTTVSCTSTFSVDSSSCYPDGENNRVACRDMEAGKWYHCEGYATMYKNMQDDSFMIYWESPDNTDDIYLDNIAVTIMYTMPAGDYEK